jgi:hypothetical protein
VGGASWGSKTCVVFASASTSTPAKESRSPRAHAPA